MQKLLFLGISLILAGFALVFIDAISGGTSPSAGGVVFVGPIPIVFGSGPSGGWLALLSVVIGGVMLALVLLWGWRFLETKRDLPEETI